MRVATQCGLPLSAELAEFAEQRAESPTHPAPVAAPAAAEEEDRALLAERGAASGRWWQPRHTSRRLLATCALLAPLALLLRHGLKREGPPVLAGEAPLMGPNTKQLQLLQRLDGQLYGPKGWKPAPVATCVIDVGQSTISLGEMSNNIHIASKVCAKLQGREGPVYNSDRAACSAILGNVIAATLYVISYAAQAASDCSESFLPNNNAGCTADVPGLLNGFATTIAAGSALGGGSCRQYEKVIHGSPPASEEEQLFVDRLFGRRLAGPAGNSSGGAAYGRRRLEAMQTPHRSSPPPQAQKEAKRLDNAEGLARLREMAGSFARRARKMPTDETMATALNQSEPEARRHLDHAGRVKYLRDILQKMERSAEEFRATHKAEEERYKRARSINEAVKESKDDWERSSAIALCFFNLVHGTLFLARAMLFINLSVQDCPGASGPQKPDRFTDITPGFVTAKAKCAVDVFGVYGSFMYTAMYYAYTAATCPVVPPDRAQCAGDIIATFTTFGSVGNAASDLQFTCGNLTLNRLRGPPRGSDSLGAAPPMLLR